MMEYDTKDMQGHARAYLGLKEHCSNKYSQEWATTHLKVTNRCGKLMLR